MMTTAARVGADLGTVLGVWAHPDDEAYLSAGLMALARRAGQRVVVVTVVTFGPDGLTGHADHRTVSAWTTAAWRASGRPGRLLHATLTPEFHAAWGPVNDRVGIWMDDVRPATPAGELGLALALDEETLDLKYAALRAQASQTAPLIATLGPQTYRRWWATESFVEVSGVR